MSAQTIVIVLLACLAAIHGANLRNLHHNTELAPAEKEGRILVVPTLGAVIFTGLKVTWFLISTAWSIVGYKLAAIALVAKVATWIAQNGFSAILGAAVTLAFCKLTGKCSLDYAQEYELPDLALAAKHLADGTIKFTS